MRRYKEIDVTAVTTYSAKDRVSKVTTDLEAKPAYAGMSMADFLNSLPSILKADDLKQVAKAVVRAKSLKKPVIAMLGGHVIKTGCSPVLSDLAENGYITHFASNGSA
jgi:enoyl-CoA hydratase/carnithine racemase